MSVKFNNYNIIINQVITEKSASDRMEHNKYTFFVDPRANKVQIKEAVESLFDVKVLSVNTINVASKPKTMGRFRGRSSAMKKATVRVAEGGRIKLMEGP
ncbi:MAG: 50S ribosomal protein L23 [Elusimicrobia bacterium]|nr:50S ribosomal protein L23 [Elusimicrobiota bacterium]